MNIRDFIGDVISVAFGIDEQIRRVQNPDPSSSELHTRNNIQASKKVFVPVENPISVGVFENRYLVCAGCVMRGRRRNTVENRPQVTIVLDDLKSCRKGILQVLDDPKPTSFVKADIEWLADHGFAGHDIHRQRVWKNEPFK